MFKFTKLSDQQFLILGENLAGKKAVICGRSKHVGLPIAMMLHSNQNSGEILAGLFLTCKFVSAGYY